MRLNDRLYNIGLEAIGGIAVVIATTVLLLAAPVIGDWINNGVAGAARAIGLIP